MTVAQRSARKLTVASVRDLQDALASIESAYLAVVYDVDQWLEYSNRTDDYARECRRDSREVILTHADDVADAAVRLVRILRPSALKA